MLGELLRELDSEMFFVLLIVGGALSAATLISLGSVAMITWRKVRRDEMVFELKREMLAQGMSADEIVKVVGATPPSPWTTSSWTCGGKKRRDAIIAASAASASLS
ncbi:MAG: hypothetical protein U0836_20435 [Pirellulales bacterium]